MLYLEEIGAYCVVVKEVAEGRSEFMPWGRIALTVARHNASDPRRTGFPELVMRATLASDGALVVTSATHLSEDERYRWLNDSLSVGVGEVRSQEDRPTELVIEWAEVVWEPVSV